METQVIFLQKVKRNNQIYIERNSNWFCDQSWQTKWKSLLILHLFNFVHTMFVQQLVKWTFQFVQCSLKFLQYCTNATHFVQSLYELWYLIRFLLKSPGCRPLVLLQAASRLWTIVAVSAAPVLAGGHKFGCRILYLFTQTHKHTRTHFPPLDSFDSCPFLVSFRRFFLEAIKRILSQPPSFPMACPWTMPRHVRHSSQNVGAPTHWSFPACSWRKHEVSSLL